MIAAQWEALGLKDAPNGVCVCWGWWELRRLCVVCSYPGADTHTNAHTPSQAHSYPPTHTCARLYTVGDNGVHASASPFEGLAERLNWCGADLATDSFGQALLQSGVPAKMITNWTIDPQVAYLDGSKGSLFDSLEDMDAPECLAKCKELTKANVDSLYQQDGPEAQKIAEVIPYFPFKGEISIQLQYHKCFVY